jgi:iron(III) transport system substrate-binding protein
MLLFILAGVLVSCASGPKSEVEKAIADAQTLSYSELLDKAKEEIGTNELQVFGNSSALEKALIAFSESTGIKTKNNQYGDMDLYNKLTSTIGASTYSADMILAQDGNSLQSLLINTKFVKNYIPKEYKAVLSNDDLTPATATIYLNKVFMYNNVNTTNLITNVWQLAGKASDTGHVANPSFKPATTESVNANFLIMLTSPEWVKKLETAYKDFYGSSYVKEAGFPNIGYKWIKEFLANSNKHSSDGTATENLPKGNPGNVVLANFNKTKGIKTPEDKAKLTVAAYDAHVKGFDGFVYKMYSLIASNAKYPYAAAAFINYITSSEGYDAAWGGLVGYYSANPNTAIASGDKPLSFWKDKVFFDRFAFHSNIIAE